RHTFDPNTCRLIETRDESDTNPAKQLKTTFTYDPAYGNLTDVSMDSVDGSAQDRSSHFSYDSDSQYPTSVTTNGVNLTTTVVWDYLLGQPMSVTGPDGLQTQRFYDVLGRLKSEFELGTDGNTIHSTSLTYNDCGSCFPQNSRYFVYALESDGS